MSRLIWSVILSFVFAIALGPAVIPWLRKMKFGQTIYELGPETHKKKQGTPTMGGIIFAIPMLVVSLVMSFETSRWSFLPVLLVSTAGFGLIGFVDDWIIVKKKRSLGLTARQKLIAQVVLAAGLAVWAYLSPLVGSKLLVPFTSYELELSWFFIPVMIVVIVGAVNSANLLDGVDGLLGGCAMLDFATLSMLVMAFSTQVPFELQGDYMNVMLFSGCAAGALLGYLRYNSHPASVIMGDIGSFAIGGALVGVCLVTRLSIVLPIIALMMVVSTVSDLIQFAYFRHTKGKRFFRMAPFHHHLELGGMSETRIVSLYMIITALMCLLTLLWVAA